jgi:hypothetical protein
MGAIATVVMALCSSGDHIVAQRHIYSGTQLFLQGVCPRFGIDVTFVDATEPGALAGAVRPGRTMLVVAETPANPQLALTDLDELGAIAGPFTVVDSTFATPIIQRPHDHGVDLVIHSATKGIAGHNDATLGIVTGAADVLEAVWTYSVLHGACASPFDAMNGLRGVRTLPVRIERQSATALRLAEWLETHPAVACVRYPHLPSHPQHDLAKRQMATAAPCWPSTCRWPPGREGVRRGTPPGPHRRDARRSRDARRQPGQLDPRRAVGHRAGGRRHRAGPHPRLGRPRAPRRPAGRLRACADPDLIGPGLGPLVRLVGGPVPPVRQGALLAGPSSSASSSRVATARDRFGRRSAICCSPFSR